jgi:GT2 family glycosyltransferase
MSPTTPFVRALVVTHGRPEFLTETLASLAAQSRPVDSAFVVVSGRALEDDDDIVVPPGLAIEIGRVKGSTFGKAVDALLGEVEEREGEWLWLLHDDSAPEADALEHLLAQAAKRRLAGIVGAAQVRWDDPTRLVNIGTTVSRRGARRLSLAEGDDLDQGQHYEMEDVLAVGLAGAIVTRGVWQRLGGTDPAYGRFGDSADFCRRAWRAGYDVVIAPRARVRHAQASLAQRATPGDAGGDARATHASRRAAEWYHAIAWSSAWLGPVLFAWCVASSLARAALRLTASDLRLVAAELRVPLLLWARIGRLPASRAAIRRVSKGGERVEDPLLATAGDVFRFLRTRELGAFEAWRAESRPSDVQHRELASLATRRRWTLGGLAVFMLAIAVALFGTWYAPLARGEALVGAALGTTDVSTAELWLRSFTGWSDAGLGSGSLDGGFAALMLPFSLVPGGLAMGIGLLLLLSPLLAALSAWFAAGAATRSLVARTLAAILWGVWPALIQSVSDGRVGAVIVHLMLPLFALAVARSIGVDRRDRLADGAIFPPSRLGSPSAAAIASLALAVITVASPVLLLPLVLAVVVVALGSTVHWRFALTIPLPALVLQGPALVAAWHGWGAAGWFSPLVREDGPALASAPASGWDLLWGVAQHPPVWPDFPGVGTVVLTYGAGVLLVAAALAALASGRSAGAVASGWALALAGLAVAAVSERTVSVVAGPDGQSVANGWAGPGLSLLGLGLLCAACAAAPPGWTPGVAWRARPLRAVAGALVMGVLAVYVAGTVWPGRAFGGDVHPSVPTVLPLVATLEQRSEPISRSLVLWQDDAGLVRYTVEARDGSTTLAGRGATTWTAAPEGGADASVLAPAIGTLAGGGDGAADLLVGWGISTVVVAPGSPALESELLRSPELSLIGASDLGRSWRVKTDGGVPGARAWIQTDLGDRMPLSSTPVGLTESLVAAASGRVILAVPADARWSATLDGRALSPAEADGRQAFALGGGGGVLRVAYYDSTYRAWWWAGVVALLWAAASSVPLHDRRFTRPSP